MRICKQFTLAVIFAIAGIAFTACDNGTGVGSGTDAGSGTGAGRETDTGKETDVGRADVTIVGVWIGRITQEEYFDAEKGDWVYNDIVGVWDFKTNGSLLISSSNEAYDNGAYTWGYSSLTNRLFIHFYSGYDFLDFAGYDIYMAPDNSQMILYKVSNYNGDYMQCYILRRQ